MLTALDQSIERVRWQPKDGGGTPRPGHARKKYDRGERRQSSSKSRTRSGRSQPGGRDELLDGNDGTNRITPVMRTKRTTKKSNYGLDEPPEDEQPAVVVSMPSIEVTEREVFRDEIDLTTGPTQADYLVAATLKHSKLDTLGEASSAVVPPRITMDQNRVLVNLFHKPTPWYRKVKFQMALCAIAMVVIGVTLAVMLGGKSQNQVSMSPPETTSTESELLPIDVLEYQEASPTERPVRLRKARI